MKPQCPKCTEDDDLPDLIFIVPQDSMGMVYVNYVPATNYYEPAIRRWHHHDPTVYTERYRCSEDHQWIVRFRFGCKGCGEKKTIDVEVEVVMPLRDMAEIATPYLTFISAVQTAKEMHDG